MKELIPVSKQTINEVETLTCDARALHEFLGSKQHFTDWIKKRIEKYGFAEGVDFIIHKKMINDTVCLEAVYILSIDMAKQLAMVENNDKGAEVRRYFIECERIAKEAAAGYKTKPRKSSAEVTARSVATSYRMLARMKDVYPPEMCAVFAAKSVNALTGEPLAGLLPQVRDNRDQWLSPTAQGGRLNVHPNTIGRALTALGLHGKNDLEHKWSQPLADKSRYSNKEVISYVYDPEVVLPALKKYFDDGGPDSGEPLN